MASVVACPRRHGMGCASGITVDITPVHLSELSQAKRRHRHATGNLCLLDPLLATGHGDTSVAQHSRQLAGLS